jgi:hypothetical protein
MPKTVDQIEAEIEAFKNANPGWMTNAGDKALITELTKEKNTISGKCLR